MDRPEVRRALDELVAGRWVVSYEIDDAGVKTYTATRPVGWSGTDDPFERLEAPAYGELLSLITRRARQPVPPPRNGRAR
ncbi:hypothetical protein ACIBFB_13735 [Nocardiopsis sp. NPDC050513]|uniref:hypothetical protein n=1 Tax=Nocardiopsis sp. NPDC050513 TaxID=3364338 RepID=UPI0037AE5B1E